MPRNVRNFWIDLNVDGRKSTVSTGPVSKDGGFSMTIKIRNNGSISPFKLTLEGRVLPDGTLCVDSNKGVLLTGSR